MERLTDKLHKEAECSLCIETIKNPKILPCHHGFCCECLNRLAAVRRQQGLSSFECPECKAPYGLPESSRFDAFPASFHHNRLLDLLALVDVDRDLQSCSICELREMDYFCGECKVCICAKCFIRGHKDHARLEIQDAARQNKLRITEMLHQIKDEVLSCQQELQLDKLTFRAIEEQKNIAKSTVRTTVEELIRVLKTHEADLLSELDDLYEEQQRIHLIQQSTTELRLATLNSYLDCGEVLLEKDVTWELAKLDQNIVRKCFEFLDAKEAQRKKYVTGDFARNKQFIDTVMNGDFGGVVQSCTDPLRSIAEGKGLKEAECGELAEFTIVTNDSNGETCYNETDQFTVSVTSHRGESVETKIDDCKDGTYHVTYIPQRHGEHHVIIKVKGRLLLRTSVHVTPHQYRAVGSFGSQGTGKGQFDSPTGIAVSSTGDIAVADTDNGRVQLFTSEGKYLSEFGSEFFSSKGRLHNPISVAYTRWDEIIVVDHGAPERLVGLYSDRGQFIREFSPSHLQSPRSISITREDHVAVCDTEDRCIKILSRDGEKLLHSFKGANCAQSPYNVVDHTNRYFVTYFRTGAVKVWNKAGKFLFDIVSPRESLNKEFLGPLGLTIDTFGNLVVCESISNRLQVFSLEGHCLSTIGEVGTAEGQFKWPADLAVAKDGRIFVVDQGNHRIQIFK